MLAEIHFNSEFFKYILIAVAAPFWLPFLKALWSDFDRSLRDEGGLLGYGPTPTWLEEKRRKEDEDEGEYTSSLINQTWEQAGRRGPRGSNFPPPQSSSNASGGRTGIAGGRSSAGREAPRRTRGGGFRSST